MFALLPQIYPRVFVYYFVRNYFRLLDDIFHKWLINFDIEPFYKLINELDPDLKFIFEKLTTDINFLDINIKIVDNQLHFDIYHKPTNSFSYLKYSSCHPSHTRNNISLSLAGLIISRPIVGGPCYHTSVVSQILHVIMEPTLTFIKHILKDSFDFIDRIDIQCTVNTILSTCDIKSLYTNVKYDVFL